MEVDDLIPISALQHLVFCERQAALIHVERLWRDDTSTTQGHLVHERPDTPGSALQAGVKVARALPLVSRRLGIFGVADMVELHRDPQAPKGFRPVPVEVKKGSTKNLRADQVQLCAQAICLEEEFGVRVTSAWLFYSASHRRKLIELDDGLRDQTGRVVERLREIIARHLVPMPLVSEKVCAKCSLEALCLPRATRDRDRALRYVEALARSRE
ncbi:MAG TPA: CRISPR-associated protein Cas4 [Polyangia bacterium]|jgi:CRISPR-associated exonuclease Cas4|nr:CRISPR-associated protein Cas4 [Polyangia bacterium]